MTRVDVLTGVAVAGRVADGVGVTVNMASPTSCTWKKASAAAAASNSAIARIPTTMTRNSAGCVMGPRGRRAGREPPYPCVMRAACQRGHDANSPPRHRYTCSDGSIAVGAPSA